MLQDTYGLNPRLLPQSLHDSYGAPKPKLARIAHEEHEMNWVEAIKGKAEISSPFDYASRLIEVMLLGVVSMRAGEDCTTAPPGASRTPSRTAATPSIPTSSSRASTGRAGS